MRSYSEARLRSAFADVLTAVLATAAVGCGGSTNDGPSQFDTNVAAAPKPVTPGFTSLCAQSQKSFLQGLKATPALDGIEQRTEAAFPLGYNMGATPAEQGDAWKAFPGEIAGTLCMTATNKDACLAEVNGYRFLPPTRAECTAKYGQASYSTPPTTCAATYYLYTRGDQIGVAQTDAEIKALMGTVDTLEEAMYLTTSAGYRESCGATSSGFPDSEFRQNADGSFDLHLIESKNCEKTSYALEVHVDYAGTVTETTKTDLSSDPGCAVAGRRPAGFRLVEDGSSVGAHFGTMAQLEAASVVAFRRLHRQLAAVGAPVDLLARIRKAARDEVRHARATGALARKYGVTPSGPEIAPEREMSLFEIAIENAREGCVRETFGALVAHLQAERAGDADVRRVMTEIADEETAHAALSWDLAAWLESQLDDEQRQALARERQQALAALSRALEAPADSRIVLASGIPTPALSARMLEGLAPLLLAA